MVELSFSAGPGRARDASRGEKDRAPAARYANCERYSSA